MSIRIGSRRDARKALKGELESIGSGAYRAVYADRNRKVAYKVCHLRVDSYANDEEMDAYIQACHASPSARDIFAPTTQWSFMLPFSELVPEGDVEWMWCRDNCVRDKRVVGHFQWCPMGCDYEHTEELLTYAEHKHPATLRVVVNAQPMYPSTGDSLRRSGLQSDMSVYWIARDAVLDAADEFDVNDMHDGNWCVDENGKPWITDYQFGMGK